MLGGRPAARLRQHKVLQNFRGDPIRCADNSSRSPSGEIALIAMTPLPVVHRAGVALRAFACVALLALAAGAWGASPGLDPGQRLRLTPEQRRDMWERMSPEQRDAWRNARSQDERQRAWQGLSPDQRRGMWEGLSPEQREMMLRRLPPEQRQDMRRHMSPEERQAMRHRFLEQAPPGPGAQAGGPRRARCTRCRPRNGSACASRSARRSARSTAAGRDGREGRERGEGRPAVTCDGRGPRDNAGEEGVGA